MNLYEYQAKSLFQDYNIPVLNSLVASSVKEAESAMQKLKGKAWVVKAQVLAGGRGKAGGIQLVKSLEELQKAAKKLIGHPLVTAQTSAKGERVEKVLIEEACSIQKEYYLSLCVDAQRSQVSFIVSPEGGVDIEEVSMKSPEKIKKIHISSAGFQIYHAWSIGAFLGLSQKQDISQIYKLCKNLYQLFRDQDASLVEINPLVRDDQNQWVALDGKISVDENALFRHENFQKWQASQPQEESEALAAQYGISFIPLEGTIGCMVNGAGLAMATMDIIKFYGASPANFLDVGGGADEDKVIKAFEIILKSKEVRAILVNIFGGIMRCDVIAQSLVKACQKQELKVPIVVRLEGTKHKEGLKILKESGLHLIAASDLDQAAQKVVEVAKV